MGTNPFRRKGLIKENTLDGSAVDALPERTEARILPIVTDIPRQQKAKPVKTVRIISPHSATSDEENGTAHRYSPPQRPTVLSSPSATSFSKDSEKESQDDPFSAGSDTGSVSTDDDAIQKEQSSGSFKTEAGSELSSMMPANPFKRTLASTSTDSKHSPITGSRPTDDQSPRGKQQATTRTHYDVDEFKRLLLTGQKSTSGPSAVNVPHVDATPQTNIGDNSSNTDSSSISRQSIFDSATGTAQSPLQESPGTSEAGSPLEDDRQQPIAGQVSIPSKAKPPAPRHRHGKPVKTNHPQTVSFADPILTSPAFDGVSPSSPPSSRSLEELERTDKPLPPLPTGLGEGVSTVERPSDETNATYQKRSPPEIPLSRRHSQFKSTASTQPQRSSFASFEGLMDHSSLSRSPSNSSTRVPPPPPPRRSGGLSTLDSLSSVSTSSSIPPLNSQHRPEDVNSGSPNSRPHAPPTYSPTVSSFKRHQTQPESSPPAMAPPPPPRRRGSSQSSYNLSRLSGDYRTAATARLRIDSGASSVSQLHLTSTAPSSSNANSKDVMADISALQREVDELRGKFKY